jgi:hypothetical protein
MVRSAAANANRPICAKEAKNDFQKSWRLSDASALEAGQDGPNVNHPNCTREAGKPQTRSSVSDCPDVSRLDPGHFD